MALYVLIYFKVKWMQFKFDLQSDWTERLVWFYFTYRLGTLTQWLAPRFLDLGHLHDSDFFFWEGSIFGERIDKHIKEKTKYSVSYT